MTQTKATTQITRIGLVGIPVTDPDRALEFYTGTLGFDKRLDVVFGNGHRWIEVVPPGTQTAIALVPAGSEQQPGIRLVTEDADADHAHLRGRGTDTDPEVTRLPTPVPPMFTVRDPAVTRCSSSRTTDRSRYCRARNQHPKRADRGVLAGGSSRLVTR